MGQSGNVPDPALLAAQAQHSEQLQPADRVADQGTLRWLLERGWAQLAGSSESARLEAEVLLAHAIRQPRGYLLAHDDEAIDEATIARYQSMLARRADGEPLAYLTGEREFWSLPLAVTAQVLIPRPETELAVERCLALRDAAPAAGRRSALWASPERSVEILCSTAICVPAPMKNAPVVGEKSPC